MDTEGNEGTSPTGSSNVPLNLLADEGIIFLDFACFHVTLFLLELNIDFTAKHHDLTLET